MARKRMFSSEVVRSDMFLDLPISSQLLYYHFGMIADDDGIVASVKRELSYLGFGSIDDLKILNEKRLIDFTSDGKVLFIVDWLKNNYLQNDRYNPTNQLEAKIELAEKGYKFKKNDFGNKMYTKRIQSASTDKDIDIVIDKDIDKEQEERINKKPLVVLVEFFETELGRPLSPTELEMISSWKENFQIDLIKRAFKEAVLQNKRTFKYVNGILNNCRSKGIKTAIEFEADNEKHQISKNQSFSKVGQVPEWAKKPQKAEATQEEMDALEERFKKLEQREVTD